jgi:polysaccharide biosynthesis/export protein
VSKLMQPTHSRRRAVSSWALVALAASWLVAPAAMAQSRPSGTKEQDATTPTDYVIGPGDTLHVFVWKEPDLSRDVAVRVDGKITMPLVGDVEAAGRTPQQLGAELGKGLAKFLESPQVTLAVAQANSSRFFIIGQVVKSGDFPLTSRVNVLQALALAGGFREYAKTDEIVIIREGKGGQSVIPVNYKKLESGRDMSQNVPIRPGDVIVVP